MLSSPSHNSAHGNNLSDVVYLSKFIKIQYIIYKTKQTKKTIDNKFCDHSFQSVLVDDRLVDFISS